MVFRFPLIGCALLAALPPLLCAQTAPAPAPRASKGLPARAAAADYGAHAQAGSITIAAEFDGHEIPTLDSTLTAEDFVTVEVGIFGAPGAHATISASDFSLRINGRKSGIPSEGFASMVRNLRDPSWSPPESKEKEKPKAGGLNTGGGDQNDSTPVVVHIPPEMERAMVQKVQAAALPEGDRALPIAGLLYFKYGGQAKGIHDVELVYEGSAGKASIVLQR